MYAVFTQTLTINGTANVRDSKWDIHIVEEGQLDPTNITGSAKVLTKPTASTTSISDFALSLTTPGDTIEYTFNVINEGDYDAEISTLTKNGVTCTANGSTSDPEAVKVCNKLEYTLKYNNGSTVSQGDTLLSKQTQTMKLTIKYQEFDDPSLLPTTNVSISGLGITLQYRQKGSAKVNADGTTPYVEPTYEIGDTITVGGEQYYVIENSDSSKDYVTALKSNPLTVDEINANKIGSDNINHVNRYTWDGVGTAYDFNDSNHTGGMAYYTSATCGNATPGGLYSSSGCASENATSYNSSDIKYVVDKWASTTFSSNELAIDSNGYKARLITKDELVNNLGCTSDKCGNSSYNWTYNNEYWYWTMTPSKFSSHVWIVFSDGILRYDYVNGGGAVHPVINIYKSKIWEG